MDLKPADASQHWVHHFVWVAASVTLVFAALVFALIALTNGNGMHAAAWLACATIGAAGILFRNSLPPFFGILLAISATANTAGYVFNLWHDRTSFDEIIHGFTFFAVTAAAGWFVIERTQQLEGIYRKAAAFAAVVGLSWEVFEWSIGIIGDFRDTTIDLVMDITGALAAAALLHVVARRRARDDEGSTTRNLSPES